MAVDSLYGLQLFWSVYMLCMQMNETNTEDKLYVALEIVHMISHII